MSQRGAEPSGKENLWADLNIKASRAEKPAEGLWTGLGEKLDVSKHKPKGVSTVELSKQTFQGEEFYILKNTVMETYLRLDRKGFFLWSLMDGKHSLTDIILAYLLEYGVPPFDQLSDLLSLLKNGSFLDEKAPDLYGLLLNRSSSEVLRGRPVFKKLSYFWNKISQGELDFDADGYFGWIYNHGGQLLYTGPAKAFWIIISVFGSVLFIREFTDGRINFAGLESFATLGVVSLFLFNYLLTFFHEHGHGMTVKSFGRRVNKGGFLIYYGMPCIFVDTTDMWLGTKSQRIAVSWAGPFTTVIIGSICSIVITMFRSSEYQPMLFEIAVIGMLSALMNLNPLLEWDGYYMLMNYLEIPGLRAKSFEFMRETLWRKALSGQLGFSREEKIFVVFGALAGVWSIIAVLLIPHFWAEVIYPLFGPIWSGPWNGIKIAMTVLGILLILSVASTTVAKIWKEAGQIWDAVKHIRDA